MDQNHHQQQYRNYFGSSTDSSTATISTTNNNPKSGGDDGILSNFDLIILDAKPIDSSPTTSFQRPTSIIVNEHGAKFVIGHLYQEHESLCTPQQYQIILQDQPSNYTQQHLLQSHHHAQELQHPQHSVDHQIIECHNQKQNQPYQELHVSTSDQELITIQPSTFHDKTKILPITSVIIYPALLQPQPQPQPPPSPEQPELLPSIVTELDNSTLELNQSTEDQLVLVKEHNASTNTNIPKINKNEPIKCPLCNVILKNTKGLKMHQEIHDGVKKFHCDECPKSFLRSNQLKSHKKVHTGERPYTCSVCLKSFAQSSNYRAHMKIHTGSHPFCCKFCNKRYGSAEDLANHNIVHVGINRYRCTICSKEYQRSDNLKNHKLSHTGDKPFPCRICDKRFSHSSILSVHMRTHTGEKPYECTTCGKKFAQWTNYNRHLSLHMGDKPHVCGVCKKSFARVAALKNHEKVHENGRILECKICDKSFLHDVTFEQHIKAHSGICDVCGLRIEGGLREYRRHQRVQHQNRVKCDICRKSFKSYNAILEHMNAEHISEKMYKCNECDSFFSVILLENHCRKMHPYYEYQECPYCKCDFPNSSILIEHLKSHLGEKPLQCSQCGKLFKRYGHYKSHKCVRHALKRETEAKQAAKKKLEINQRSNVNQPDYQLNDSKDIIKMETHSESQLSNCAMDISEISKEKILNDNILASTNLIIKNELNDEQKILLPPSQFSENSTNKNDGASELDDDDDKYDSDLIGVTVWHNKNTDDDDDDDDNDVGEENIHTESVFCETLSSKSIPKPKNKRFKSKQKNINKNYNKNKTNKVFINKNKKTYDNNTQCEEPQTCQICNRQFRNQRSLKVHLETHGEKRFQCERCAMSFVRRSQLKSHTYTHTGERPYQCEICSKQFSQTSVLRIHLRTHTGAKPYQCDLCEKRFSQSANYHRHRALHSGEKPHQCIACGKRFARLAALKKHENIHTNILVTMPQQSRKQKKLKTRSNDDDQSTTIIIKKKKPTPKLQPKKRKSQLITDLINEPLPLPPPDKLSPLGFIGDKPYPCKICLKTFSQTSILTVHMRIHTGERPYKCSSCTKSFTQWTNYNRHLSVHTGARPYVCEYCDKKFARLQTLKIHLKTHFKYVDIGDGL